MKLLGVFHVFKLQSKIRLKNSIRVPCLFWPHQLDILMKNRQLPVKNRSLLHNRLESNENWLKTTSSCASSCKMKPINWWTPANNKFMSLIAIRANSQFVLTASSWSINEFLTCPRIHKEVLVGNSIFSITLYKSLNQKVSRDDDEGKSRSNEPINV